MNSNELYKQLIKTILMENKILTLFFIGDNKFAKKYDKVKVIYKSADGEIEIKVYLNGLENPLNGFYFDYTLDYAKLIEMLETDLFLYHHSVKPKNFIFETYEIEHLDGIY